MFIKQPLKTQKKLKKWEIMYQNAIYNCIFDLTEVADVSRALEACHVNYIFLGSSLRVPSFIITEYVWHILWWGVFATLPPKKPILNKVNKCSAKISFQKISFFHLMGTNSLRTLFTQKFLYLLFCGERNCWCTLE